MLALNSNGSAPHGAPAAPRLKDSKVWLLPVAPVTAGLLATLWRNCQPATSVLLVLALYVPSARGDEWSGWFQLDYDKIAERAGVCVRSVGESFAALRAEGLLETVEVRSSVAPLHTPQRYRVHSRLMQYGPGRFVTIRATLVNSGEWARFPGIAARHLWIAEQALAPIQHPDAYLARLEDNHMPDAEERLAAIQRDGALSTSELARVTGLSRTWVAKLRTDAILTGRYAA